MEMCEIRILNESIALVSRTTEVPEIRQILSLKDEVEYVPIRSLSEAPDTGTIVEEESQQQEQEQETYSQKQERERWS